MELPATTKPVTPIKCPRCGQPDFTQTGYGLWDGQLASGVFHKVKCLNCCTVWYGTQTHDQADKGVDPEWVECTW
jgi:ribosomal protein S27E